MTWKPSYSASECAVLIAADAITERCGRGSVERAMEVIRTDITQCLPFSQPVRMSGVWLRGFELSAFYERARTYAEVTAVEEDVLDPLIWLSTADDAEKQLQAAEPQADEDFWKINAYRIDFIGRKSLCESGYGHLGAASHEVIVSNFLDVTVLPIKRDD